MSGLYASSPDMLRNLAPIMESPIWAATVSKLESATSSFSNSRTYPVFPYMASFSLFFSLIPVIIISSLETVGLVKKSLSFSDTSVTDSISVKNPSLSIVQFPVGLIKLSESILAPPLNITFPSASTTALQSSCPLEKSHLMKCKYPLLSRRAFAVSSIAAHPNNWRNVIFSGTSDIIRLPCCIVPPNGMFNVSHASLTRLIIV